MNEWWARLTGQQKVLVGAGGVAVLVLGYRWWKRRTTSSSGATLVPTAPAGGQATEPTASVTTPGGSSYNGPASALPSFYANTPGTAGADSASVTLPSGAAYTGPASGLQQVLGELTPATPAPAKPAAAEPGVGLFGSAQVAELQKELAAGAISQQEYSDVANAYSTMAAQSPTSAQSVHYVWGPTGVTTVPAVG